MVIELDGHNPKRWTMDKALSEFKASPVVKLIDMDLEMVEDFVSKDFGIDAMMAITPLV